MDPTLLDGEKNWEFAYWVAKIIIQQSSLTFYYFPIWTPTKDNEPKMLNRVGDLFSIVIKPCLVESLKLIEFKNSVKNGL